MTFKNFDYAAMLTAIIVSFILIIGFILFICNMGASIPFVNNHIITVGNQPGWCENDGVFHAFVYDAYGNGEYKGNWSQVKNFLVYQHNKYGVNSVIDSPTIFDEKRSDIIYSLDEYITMKDKQCGNGTPLLYGLDILDPGLTPIPTTPITIATTIPTYDYINSEFGKVAV